MASRPPTAGLKNPPAAPVNPASTASIQTSATPTISSAAVSPLRETRARSESTITVRRDTRSATTPPISSVATIGSVRQAITMPTSVAEPPSSSTANASAMPHHPVAEHRYRLRAEQQPELAQAQDSHRRSD